MNISRNTLQLLAACGMLGVTFTSCFDDKYDLSDIDTTVRIDVKDLVVPINIDVIHLKNLIDIKEGDRLQIVDGRYCVIESGDFNSSDIVINPVHLNAPVIAPTDVDVRIPEVNGGVAPKDYPNELTYLLNSPAATFDFPAAGSDNVVDIDSVFSTFTVGIDIKFDGISSLVKRLNFEDLSIQLPRGLELTVTPAGDYEPESGMLHFESLTTQQSLLSVAMNVSAADFHKMGGACNGGHITLQGEMHVADGRLKITPDDLNPNINISDLPPVMSMHVDYTMSDIDIREFSGTLTYNIENVNINDIDLTDMPDVLAQEGTSIMLVNPQLYLEVTNPIHRYDLKVETGMTITSYPRFDGGNTVVSTLDKSYFTITGQGSEGINHFCLSPMMPDNLIEGFTDATHVGFTQLSGALNCGNGLPSRLGVKLDNPNVPVQRVSRFELGTNLNAVHGHYTMLAPLQFENGTTVIYADTLDGWGSDDLDKMTIEHLDVDLTVSSDLPLGANLTGYPIDRNGNQIGNVTIEGCYIPAKASNVAMTLHVTGTVTNLDGIIFRADVNSDDSKEVLQPEMSLSLTNIRPRVTGYYQKEL